MYVYSTSIAILIGSLFDTEMEKKKQENQSTCTVHTRSKSSHSNSHSFLPSFLSFLLTYSIQLVFHVCAAPNQSEREDAARCAQMLVLNPGYSCLADAVISAWHVSAGILVRLGNSGQPRLVWSTFAQHSIAVGCLSVRILHVHVHVHVFIIL